jgi:hypothetical protein
VVWEWPELADTEPFEFEIEPWLPARAAEEFRARFAELQRQRGLALSYSADCLETIGPAAASRSADHGSDPQDVAMPSRPPQRFVRA